MPKRATRVAIAFVVVTGAFLACATLAGAAKGPTYTPKLCQKPRIEPGRILIACGDGNAWVKVTRYTYYNRREAGGKGKFFGNDCIPNCAEGSFHKYSTRFRLTKPRWDRCNGRRVRYFHVIKIRWKGARPAGAKKKAKLPLWCFP